MIRIDAIWLATQPLDMRAGPDTALARVVQVFGAARPHCAYLFANRRGNRMKVLIHDGLGLWLCARRLHRGKFHWGEPWRGDRLQLKRIGEDISEKLDYVPGTFTVERHIRGKWACANCETLIQAPVPPHVIDKGLPTTGLLAQVLVAKYADHLPLYRQERIFGRAGLTLPRFTLAEWVGACGVQLQPLVDALRDAVLAQPVLHADETPVSMLAPGKKKTHRAYVWAYSTTAFSALKAVVYDFAPSRAGAHARTFLGDWRGKLVCDDYAGYKAGFGGGITEIGCMAHARRKFFELHAANKSQVAAQALTYIGQLYEVERAAKHLAPDKRQEVRETQARPVADALHQWLLAQCQKVPDGSGTARALDTASNAGRRSRATWTMAPRPSTTTGWKTRSGLGRWAVPTGCSPAHCAVANVRRP